MARDSEVKRTETNEGGVHTVREERTTTIKPSRNGDFSTPTKSNMSYLVPVIVAILLALALLSMRSGGILGTKHVSKPKTWQDTVSESVSDLQDKLNEYTGMSSDSYSTKAAKAKAAEMSARAKQAAADAASSASDAVHGHKKEPTLTDRANHAAEALHLKKKEPTYMDQAKHAADETSESIKAKLADTLESIKDTVGIHDKKEAGVKAAAAGVSAKAKADELAAKAKAQAAEQAAKAKASAQAASAKAHKDAKDYVKDQRSYATQASDYVHDKIEEVVDGVKSKVGLASEAVRHKKEEMTEEARHAANVAAENAKHATNEALYSDYGSDAKSKVHDAKRNLKQKAADFVNDNL